MYNDFFNFKLITEEDFGMNYSERLEIIFVLSGDGTLTLNESEAQYDFKEEDIFVINSFQARDIHIDRNALAISLSIDSQIIAENSPEMISPYIECKSFLYNETEQVYFNSLRTAYAECFRSFYKQESDLTIVMRSKILNILSILLTHFSVEHQKQDLKSLERLRDVLYYIHQNYKENITLDELADRVDLSSAYLSRLFKSTLDITITDYISEIRVNHASKLLVQDMTITDIAYESGFPSHNSMIFAFNKFKNMTPGKYRENLETTKHVNENSLIGDDGFSTAFNTFLTYVERDHDVQETKVNVEEIFINTKNVLKESPTAWNEMMNLGYAGRVLDSDVQSQIKKLQDEVHFKYFRTKGILDDDLMVYTIGTDLKPIINFVYIDKVIDFILSVDAKPFIEIGHVPKALAKQSKLSIRSGSNLTTPNDYSVWEHLIESLMLHLKERYGEKEVSSWLFSPFITMSFIEFNAFSLEDYTKTYLGSYQAIKKIVPTAKICGPGTTFENNDEYLKKYLEIVTKHDIKVDYYSFKSYGSLSENDNSETLKLNVTPDAFPLAVSQDERYLISGYRKVKSILNDFGIDDTKIIIEEWSNNIWQRDLANDTLFKSSYIFKTLLESSDLYEGIAYHSLNDQLDEVPPSEHIFGGAFGLFTLDGLYKSSYNAFKLLSKMGKHLLAYGDGYYVTKEGENIQLFLYNYAHYDMLYRYRHTANMDPVERYQIFNDKETVFYNFQFSGLEDSSYKIIAHTVNQESGSSFDIWANMGAPKQLTRDERMYIESKSLPKYMTKMKKSKDVLNIRTTLKAHEIKCIELIKIS